ncbi:MAG: hypothetical protein RLZZ182_1150 [Pseudomonadota bacterium]|jgi:hypothetical protein
MKVSRRGLLSLVLALPASTLSLSALAATGPWEPVKQGTAREDVSTWVRSVDGMTVKAFRGSTEVNQSALTVLALLADTQNLPNWIFKCASAQHLPSHPHDHTYARFKGIWPASPRDALFKRVVTQEAGGAIFIETRDVSGHPPAEGHVRIKSLHNIFRLTPLKGGWTKVEFETQVDLGGMVPGWLANVVSTEAALVTLEGLKREVVKPKYKIKSLADLPDYYQRSKSITLPPDH